LERASGDYFLELSFHISQRKTMLNDTVSHEDIQSLLENKFGDILEDTDLCTVGITDMIIDNVESDHNVSIVRGHLVIDYLSGSVDDIKLEIEYDADLVGDRYIQETILVFSRQ
jgi:hypothetical protein